MQVWYIEEVQEKKSTWKTKWNKMFYRVQVIQREDSYFLQIPSYQKEKAWERMGKKVGAFLQEKGISMVALDRNLQTKEILKNGIYASNISIIKGREVFKLLLPEVISYLATQKQKEIKNMEVSILVNDYTKNNIETIQKLAQTIKRVNIITNHMDKFRKIEEKLYDDLGIMITVANNKKKSLAKANIILNLDFPEELLCQYKLSKQATLINTERKITIQSKAFQGINIHFYQIAWEDERNQ